MEAQRSVRPMEKKNKRRKKKNSLGFLLQSGGSDSKKAMVVNLRLLRLVEAASADPGGARRYRGGLIGDLSFKIRKMFVQKVDVKKRQKFVTRRFDFTLALNCNVSILFKKVHLFIPRRYSRNFNFVLEFKKSK